jgi:hypothetical protein
LRVVLTLSSSGTRLLRKTGHLIATLALTVRVGTGGPVTAMTLLHLRQPKRH